MSLFIMSQWAEWCQGNIVLLLEIRGGIGRAGMDRWEGDEWQCDEVRITEAVSVRSMLCVCGINICTAAVWPLCVCVCVLGLIMSCRAGQEGGGDGGAARDHEVQR